MKEREEGRREGGILEVCALSLLPSQLLSVLCGPVSSSVFVENCRNCTFVVACQQVRK